MAEIAVDVVAAPPSSLPTPRNGGGSGVVNQVIIPGLLRVYGLTAASTNAASQYVLVFEGRTLPADGVAPLFFVPVAANATDGISWGTNGRIFRSGLILCTSSTNATKTLNTTGDTFFDVQYDYITS